MISSFIHLYPDEGLQWVQSLSLLNDGLVQCRALFTHRCNLALSVHCQHVLWEVGGNWKMQRIQGEHVQNCHKGTLELCTIEKLCGNAMHAITLPALTMSFLLS